MIQLSVIIPYYNVSAYIERCARSLMEQTLSNGIEFIFINDGSSDDSEHVLQKILADYPVRLSQIKLISLEIHLGVGRARRRGMEEASGEYLIHCDADDWVELTIYQDFVNQISQTHADIIVCPFIHEFSDRSSVETYRELPIEDCFYDQRWWSLCTHAVRRSLIEKHCIYPIETITFWEDLDLLMRIFVYAKSIVYLDVPLYHYDRTHLQSAVHLNKGTTGFQQCQKVIDHLTSFFQINAPQFISSLYLLKHSARDLYLEGAHPDYVTWSRSYPEIWPLVWKNHNLSIIYRVCYFLGSYHILWPMKSLHFIARKS